MSKERSIREDDNKGRAEGEDGLGDDFVLLEVLGESSYWRAHLPGAIRFQDTSRAAEFLSDKSAELVAYCSNFN